MYILCSLFNIFSFSIFDFPLIIILRLNSLYSFSNLSILNHPLVNIPSKYQVHSEWYKSNLPIVQFTILVNRQKFIMDSILISRVNTLKYYNLKLPSNKGFHRGIM
jgi:hypothetical protein